MLSPGLALFYDIFFNHFTLKYTYYYLIFYIPIIILKRITTTFNGTSLVLVTLTHEMFYVQSKQIIFAINPKIKPLWDFIVMSGLQVNSLEDADLHFSLMLSVKFELQCLERNMYINNEGICLQLTTDNKVFIVLEEEELLFDAATKEGFSAFLESKETQAYKIHYKQGDEWILLCKSY